MIELKFYCIKCGIELISKKFQRHFDVITGKEKFLLEWKCPKHRFWNGHTAFVSDSNGNSYPFEV